MKSIVWHFVTNRVFTLNYVDKLVIFVWAMLPAQMLWKFGDELYK